MPHVRPDPKRNAVPGQEMIYGAIQALWSAWARCRYREMFDRVRAFAVFVGYPRSGHSLVGAMVNAHRHAVISHELNVSRMILAGCSRDVLFSRILARAAWFNLRGNTSNYEYQIPHQWQGRFETVRVIGDKGGGWAAQAMQEHPDLLKRMRDTVGVPLRLIHIVRNPFDNIAAISLWHRLSMDESIAYYFSLCRTTASLAATSGDMPMITLHHEDFIREPASTLSALCAFLGLEPDSKYLDDCGSIVFVRPTQSRRRISWSAAHIGEIERRRRDYPFLHRYVFDTAEEPTQADATGHPAPVLIAPASGSWSRRFRSAAGRLAAFLDPRTKPD